MSYSPKKTEDEVLQFATKKIEELLSRVSSIASMYIEPGDTLVVKTNLESSVDFENASSMLKTIFPENPIILLPKNMEAEFSVVKKE